MSGDRPQLIFMTELAGNALVALLERPDVLDVLVAQGYGLALALVSLDAEEAAAVRLLNQHGVPLVAWLLLAPEQGDAFNAQNYPQAIARYAAFRAWATEHHLCFEAIGLEIAPPPEIVRADTWRPRPLLRRLWRAREQMIYLAARAAYTDLIVAMQRHGYEVHTYQIPWIADDRRAGSTFVQRMLDIVDLPGDVDVLLCSSSVPLDRLGGDLGGALIASYGPSADAIEIGGAGEGDPRSGPGWLPWPALRRDLLLAAQHTDTIYIDSLEGCAARGLLPNIAALDWDESAISPANRRALVATVRGLLFATLVASRFGPHVLAWAGWVMAALLWLRARRS